jgi:hypothetical protein
MRSKMPVRVERPLDARVRERAASRRRRGCCAWRAPAPARRSARPASRARGTCPRRRARRRRWVAAAQVGVPEVVEEGQR